MDCANICLGYLRYWRADICVQQVEFSNLKCLVLLILNISTSQCYPTNSCLVEGTWYIRDSRSVSVLMRGTVRFKRWAKLASKLPPLIPSPLPPTHANTSGSKASYIDTLRSIQCILPAPLVCPTYSGSLLGFRWTIRVIFVALRTLSACSLALACNAVPVVVSTVPNLLSRFTKPSRLSCILCSNGRVFCGCDSLRWASTR